MREDALRSGKEEVIPWYKIIPDWFIGWVAEHRDDPAFRRIREEKLSFSDKAWLWFGDWFITAIYPRPHRESREVRKAMKLAEKYLKNSATSDKNSRKNGGK